jgi:hypothetical protein
MSKPKLQARMRALSFDEKIKVLEKLRDRSLAIAGAGLKPKAVQDARKTATKGSGG